ncbi:MAG: 50S ribosomal protein L25 [Myxococcota bacterium]
MSRPSLNVSLRTATGKGPNRQARAAGKVPAIVYMKGKEPVMVSADPKAVVQLLKNPLGRNAAIDLQVAGEAAPRMAFIQEFVIHPLKRTIEHIDFWEITADTQLTVTVPFAGEGKSESERQGGRVRFTRDDITVRAKPADVPAKVVFDMTKLPLGDHNITISKVPLPKGVTPVFKHDFALVQVFMAKAGGAPSDGDDEKKPAATAAAKGAAPAAKGAAPAAKGAAPAAKGAAPAAKKK